MANWDYVLKFIICGDAGVGKSSLLVRLTDQRFLANSEPTVRHPHALSEHSPPPACRHSGLDFCLMSDVVGRLCLPCS